MSTINDLFIAANYDYRNMEVGRFYPVERKIRIQTLNTETGERQMERVTSVVYKGMSKGYNVLINDIPRFRCTKQHKFFDSLTGSFKSAEELFPSFIGVDSQNNNIEILLEECDEEFPVLDLEVANSHTYLSGGVLSHNTYGGTANVLASGLRMLNPYLVKYGCSLVFVNQERAQIGGYSPVPNATTTSGGFARKFFASWRGRVTRIDTYKEKGTGATTGIRMKIRNVKSKLGVPNREAEIDLDFKTGIDSEKEYDKFIVDLLCEKKGSWYDNAEWGLHAHGAAGVSTFLHEHPEIYEKAKEDVLRLICKETTMDAGNRKGTEEELEQMTPEERAFADYAAEDEENL